MSKFNKYFQFPIAALRLDKPIDQVTQKEQETRLRQIVDFCIIEVGRAVVSRDREEVVREICERYLTQQSLSVDVTDLDQRIWICGAATLKVKVETGLTNAHMESWNAINELATSGGKKQVRLRADFLWEGIEGKWDWRTLATLCAVYSGIGSAPMVRLSFNYISILALGFSSKSELLAKKQSSLLLPLHKTRWTVNALFDRGLFAKASPNRRHMWYSNSMDLLGLANALVKQKRSSDKPTSLQVTKRIQAAVAKNASKKNEPQQKIDFSATISSEAETEEARKKVLSELNVLA